MKPGNSQLTQLVAFGNVPIPAGEILRDERGIKVFFASSRRKRFFVLPI